MVTERSAFSRWPAFVVGLLVLVCLACSKSPLRSPAEGGLPVYRVESAHFEVYSDLSGERATALARDLERRYVALDLVAFPHEPLFKRRMEVIEFSAWEDLRAIGNDFHGLHTDAWEWHTGMSTIVLSGKEQEAGALMSTHELTHAFVAHHFPGAPIWLNEGLAKYCETLTFEGDQAVLGLHLVEYAQNPERTMRLDIDPDRMLSLSTLSKLSQEQFYARPDVNYVSAWSTVHALYSPMWRARFEGYLALLHGGEVPADQAFANELGSIDGAMLREKASQTVKDIGLDVRRVAIHRAPASSLGAPRRLTDAQVLTLYARAATYEPKRGLEIARRAVVLDPEDPEALVVLGSLELMVTRQTGLERLIASYRAAEPGRRARYAAAVLRWVDLGAPVETALADQMARDLAQGARTPQELEALSRYLLREKRVRAARKYAVRALQADPGRPSALETMAAVSAALEDYRGAFKLQERAVNLRGHDASPESKQALEQYRAQASQPAVR